MAALRGSYTPVYASPQQMRGESPDPRDDIYALGVIWHQLLTGDTEPGAPAGRRWEKRLQERGMNADQIGLLASCFDSDLEARPRNGGELLARLQRGVSQWQAQARRRTGDLSRNRLPSPAGR